ncbi:MAG: hypothetical protein ACRYF5_13270 [Janthinobacterium lividum]
MGYLCTLLWTKAGKKIGGFLSRTHARFIQFFQRLLFDFQLIDSIQEIGLIHRKTPTLTITTRDIYKQSGKQTNPRKSWKRADTTSWKRTAVQDEIDKSNQGKNSQSKIWRFVEATAKGQFLYSGFENQDKKIFEILKF